MANVQIPAELFHRLIDYHLLEKQDDPDLQKQIYNGLYKKLQNLANRDLYTKSKTAETAAEREEYRIKYLDAKGIHEDWRWQSDPQEK